MGKSKVRRPSLQARVTSGMSKEEKEYMFSVCSLTRLMICRPFGISSADEKNIEEEKKFYVLQPSDIFVLFGY